MPLNEHTSIKMKTKNAQLVIQKHWVNYIVPVILMLIGLSMMSTSSFIKYFGYALVAFNVVRVYSIYNVSWTLTQSEVYIRSGMFPWTKRSWHVPIFDIYESTVSYGMFGHFFGYSNIQIRRTEGMTSAIYGYALSGAKDFSGQINGLVHNFKRSKHTVVLNQAVGNKSISDELKDLAELKNRGELTQQEFDVIKQRFLGEI